ncbi:MAG: hypothetical protein A3J85_01665 [Desulfobacula sp. RIFOXYA12_FULL_46_16]|nr:MAG: hypothetical protein A2464_08945 [Deltaproteobacteria bacterium RIFOXYC2_FULL_48_10]OGR21063.1 MAG: hypothetical protein A3J85_01665 [Desulfobacula sp. RIFOXYA12_FULL_46_16]
MMGLFTKKSIPILLLSALLSSIILMASVPPVSRDALTHHLAVPKLYVQEGAIHELPEIIPSYYPQLLDLIYCIPLIFDADIIPKYIHFSFALLTALLLFLYLKKNLNHFYGLAGVLFFLSLPVIIKLSVTAYVDLGLIFFSTASLISLLKWQEDQFRFKWLVCSAVCCGFALSTKYNGLITCFLLTTFVPFIYLKKCEYRPDQKKISAQIRSLGYCISFFLITLAIFSPWMIKNYIWTQNPVYPLYNNYFNPEINTLSDDEPSEPTMNHFLIRKLIYQETLLETISIPLRIFFQGEDDDPKRFDGKLNPLLFFLPICAFLPFKRNRHADEKDGHKKILLLFSILYILIVFFQQDMRIRWIGPAIPPLVILSAFGLKNLFEFNISIMSSAQGKIYTSVLRTIPVLLLIFMAGLNAVYVFQLFRKIEPLSYITHKVTRSEYIEKFRSEYPVLQFANQDLAQGTKILALFLGNRRYYSDHDISFNHSKFKSAIQNSKNSDEIFQDLKKFHYSNLIVNYPAFNSWVNASFNAEEKKRIQDFMDVNTKLLFSKNNHGLYQLLSSKDPLSRR